jgi:hypothetical protein
MKIVSSFVRRLASWFDSQTNRAIHLTINFVIDPPITGGSSPFGDLLTPYCLVVVGENSRL